MKKKKKAYQLYKTFFSKVNLHKIYEDKVSVSYSVGRDGVRQERFMAVVDNEIDLIIRKVENQSYKFTPYKQKLISKGAAKFPRVISISTIRDRLTLRALNDVIAGVFPEARIQRPHTYIKLIGEVFDKPNQNLAFVRMDIKEFFPSIDHDILLRQIRRKVKKKQLAHLVKEAISTPTGKNQKSTVGVAQGLSISNILSSINLLDVDKKFKKKYQYFRYVDDILVICEEKSANSVFNEIRADLEALNLSCHELGEAGKSNITPVDKGAEYLGFLITPNKISVRKKSYQRMFENLLAVFTDYKHIADTKKNEEKLIWRLNLKITGCVYHKKRYGFLFFFSQIDDLRQLGRLDKFVTAELNNRGLGHLKPKIRKFIKCYHEIKFNFRNTTYFSKFDDLTIEQMILELSLAQGQPKEHYETTCTEEEIISMFSKLIMRQTKMLDQDLIEAAY